VISDFILLGTVILLYILYFLFNSLLPDDSEQLDETHCFINCINKKNSCASLNTVVTVYYGKRN